MNIQKQNLVYGPQTKFAATLIGYAKDEAEETRRLARETSNNGEENEAVVMMESARTIFKVVRAINSLRIEDASSLVAFVTAVKMSYLELADNDLLDEDNTVDLLQGVSAAYEWLLLAANASIEI